MGINSSCSIVEDCSKVEITTAIKAIDSKQIKDMIIIFGDELYILSKEL